MYVYGYVHMINSVKQLEKVDIITTKQCTVKKYFIFSLNFRHEITCKLQSVLTINNFTTFTQIKRIQLKQLKIS